MYKNKKVGYNTVLQNSNKSAIFYGRVSLKSRVQIFFSKTLILFFEEIMHWCNHSYCFFFPFLNLYVVDNEGKCICLESKNISNTGSGFWYNRKYENIFSDPIILALSITVTFLHHHIVNFVTTRPKNWCVNKKIFEEKKFCKQCDLILCILYASQKN